MAVHAVHERAWPISQDEEVTKLFRAAQRGDPGALDALLAGLRPRLVAYFMERSGRDDANDWAQVGLTRVLDVVRLDLREPAVYLLKVVANLRRLARKERTRDTWRRARVALGYQITAPVPHDVAVERAELIAAVREAVEKLPPRLRSVVRGVLEGLRPSDIAAQLHLPPATIRTRLRRARALLMRQLAPYLDVIPAGYDVKSGCRESVGHQTFLPEQNVFRTRALE